MKTSSKMVLITVLFFILFFFSALNMMKMSLKANAQKNKDAGPLITKKISLLPFQSIRISGGATLVVTASNEQTVEVQAPENYFNENQPVVKEGVLYIPDYGVGRKTRITISIPELTALQLSGDNAVTLAGFSGEMLTVNCAGTSDIEAQKCSFDYLALVSSGRASIDLKNLRAQSARVDISGEAEIQVRIENGPLSGAFSGEGTLWYYGNPSFVDIEKSAGSSVQKAEE